MHFNVEFNITDQSFTPSFGEVHEVSGGGYELGFEDGRAEGYSVGLIEGFDKGYVKGYGSCKNDIFAGSDVYDVAQNPVEQGSISSSTGGDANSTTRLRTAGVIGVKPQCAYKVATNVERVFVLQLSSAQKPLTSSNWKTPPHTIITEEDCACLRLTLSNANNSVIEPSAFEWMTIEEARFASE